MKNVLSVRVFKFFVERMFFCTLLGVFLTIFLGICFEDEVLAVSYKMMYLNPSVEIIYDGKTQGFYDVSGKTVYPISYEGTTYLPVRAISSLFNMRITWDGNKNAIYMSTEPAEGLSENAKTIDEFVPGESTLITALLNDEIVISFDGEVNTFEDVNKKRVYPISYQGTTYFVVLFYNT